MKAILYAGPRDFRVIDRPEPAPGPGEVLLHPLVCGLCFTDKHWYDGTYGRLGGMVGGHEFSAEVVGVGGDVDAVRVGDRVSIDPHIYCGQCHMCRAGLSMRCVKRGTRVIGVHPEEDGGLADLCVAPAYSCYPLVESVSSAAAACAEPMCAATRAVRHSGVRIGDNVVVFGAEDYSLFTINWLRSAGVSRIVCVDPVARRRAAALKMGADLAVDPAAGDVTGFIRAELPHGADLVFVACEDYIATSDKYLDWAFAVSREQGTVVLLRVYSPAPFHNVVPHSVWLKEVKLLSFGLFFGDEPIQGGRDRGDWALTLDAMADGRVTTPPAGAQIVRFDDLRTKQDVDAVFESLPHENTKTLISLE